MRKILFRRNKVKHFKSERKAKRYFKKHGGDMKVVSNSSIDRLFGGAPKHEFYVIKKK